MSKAKVKAGADRSAAQRRYQCRDGWLAVACRNEAHWKALAKCLGRPELAYPHAWEAAVRAPPQGPLAQVLESIFGPDPVAVWVQRLQARGVPGSPADPLPSGTEVAKRAGG